MSQPEQDFYARYLNPQEPDPPPADELPRDDADLTPSQDVQAPHTDPRLPLPTPPLTDVDAAATDEEATTMLPPASLAGPGIALPQAPEGNRPWAGAQYGPQPSGPVSPQPPQPPYYPPTYPQAQQPPYYPPQPPYYPPGAPAGQYPYPAPAGPDQAPPPAGRHSAPPPITRPASTSVGQMRAEVRQADLVPVHKPLPETGWRKRVHKVTRINLGLGPAEREWNDLKRRLGVNLRGTYLIAVMQQKGGVSKTTGTVGLGAALTRYRDDKVVAIDANPANGNLAKRVNEPSTGTWRSLVADPNLRSYSDFRHYLGKDSSSGLEVLGSDPGDDVLTGPTLIEAWRRLSRQYPIGLIDCGNQMRDDITAAILAHVDAVVVVSTTRYDGAEGAKETLNWLIDHGYPHLVRSAVMIISNVNKVTPTKAVKNLHENFERAVRAVHDIPYDPHLSEATAIDFDRLAPDTRRAFIEAAASVVDGFAGAADKDPGQGLRDFDGRGPR